MTPSIIGARRGLVAAILLVGALFGACRSTDTTAPDAPVTLGISPTTLSLSSVDTVKASTLKLSCGCGFLLDSIHYTGDTSMIHFTSRDTLCLARHSQTVQAWCSPSSMPPGPHQAAIDFIVFHTYRGVSYTYYDTIRATAQK